MKGLVFEVFLCMTVTVATTSNYSTVNTHPSVLLGLAVCEKGALRKRYIHEVG
jgi:hypothetical protein